jgi:quercetin dioxygenase-like cupin family protein
MGNQATDITEWDDPFKVEQAHEGIERRVLAFTDALMLVHYTVEEGAVFPEHEHEAVHQAVYVVEGCINLFGDHETSLERGDSFVVGPGNRHGIRGIAARSQVIDVFTPPIVEYGEMTPDVDTDCTHRE